MLLYALIGQAIHPLFALFLKYPALHSTKYIDLGHFLLIWIEKHRQTH